MSGAVSGCALCRAWVGRYVSQTGPLRWATSRAGGPSDREVSAEGSVIWMVPLGVNVN